MNTPEDASYAAAVKWAQEFRSTKKKPDPEGSFWIAFIVIALILIGIYIWVKKTGKSTTEVGTFASLDPTAKHPSMTLDSMGRVQVR